MLQRVFRCVLIRLILGFLNDVCIENFVFMKTGKKKRLKDLFVLNCTLELWVCFFLVSKLLFQFWFSAVENPYKRAL